MESLGLQMIADQYFEKDGFTNIPNEAFTGDVSITEFIEYKEFVLYKSAESALVQIIKALQTDGINMIGLHGLTRVGKSSWALQVAYGAVRMKLFDECVFVHMPEISDIKAIQSQIAKNLKLELKEGSSTQQRATQLQQRLLDEKKKILVLDGVSRDVNLNVIGIPSIGNLKILITTHRISVCKAMKCQRKILLDPLTKDEERSLIDKIKNSALEESIKFAAYKIIEQCKRCPGAVQAGRLINREKGSESILLGSIQYEPRLIFISMANIWKEFSAEQKRCMLLCSLYAAEDEEISVEELGRYAHAMGMYGSASIEYTMDRLMQAIDNLSDYHFMFLATGDRHIQLHAAARDVALRHNENMNPFSS